MLNEDKRQIAFFRFRNFEHTKKMNTGVIIC